MEIFAPAGNENSLKQAVQHGADCVYLGVDAFNARMKADNFSLDDLENVIKFCHLFDVKVFLTLNILIKPDEFRFAAEIASKAYAFGVDGIICADFGLMYFLAQKLKGCEIVLSTQANVQNSEGCAAAQKLGIRSVVLSREIDEETVVDVRKNFPDFHLEYFAHGALCVCVSGQCKLSSTVDRYSGNRGQCKQPCRQFYKCFEGNKQINSGYLLSAKDLCLIEKIDKLKSLGIDRIKIEGRNRRSEYVGQAVEVYRKAIDNKKISQNDIISLKKMFNRGDYIPGYMFSHDKGAIIYPNVQGHKGAFCGKITSIKDKYCVADLNYAAQKGDGFKILRNEREIGSGICLSNERTIKLSYSGNIKPNDDVYVTSDTSLIKQYSYFDKKLPVDLYIEAFAGKPLICKCICKNKEFNFKSDIICQPSINQTLKTQEIASQLSKTGNSHFTITNIIVKNDDIFLAKSQLNAFKRDLLSHLEKQLTQINREKADIALPEIKDQTKERRLAACISQPEQAEFVKNCDIVIIKPQEYSIEELSKFDLPEYYLDLPNFALKSDVKILTDIIKSDKIIGMAANSLYAIELAKMFNKKLFLSQGINVFNDYTAEVWNDADFVYAGELTLKEIRSFKNQNGFILAEGYGCCMTLCHCPVQLNKKCSCKNCKYVDNIVYKDDRGNRFLLKRKKIHNCYFELINNHRLSAYDKIGSENSIFIDLCGYSKEDTQKTVAAYTSLLKSGTKIELNISSQTTGGHLFKSVK